MATKTVEIPGIGQVTLVKRRGSRNIRLSFDRSGTVRVSLPSWIPYQAGIQFAESKRDWILTHKPATESLPLAGDRIGKAHRLHVVKSTQASRPSTRVGNGKVTVTIPASVDDTSPAVKQAVERGALKALKSEADQLLPQRLEQLARQHNFSYHSVTTKRLSSRWGSCSQHKDITLNTYLMQLPWELIDYVIVHELVHTEHLNHSADFWQRFEQIFPDAKERRKQLKTYRTAILPG